MLPIHPVYSEKLAQTTERSSMVYRFYATHLRCHLTQYPVQAVLSFQISFLSLLKIHRAMLALERGMEKRTPFHQSLTDGPHAPPCPSPSSIGEIT